MKILIFFLFNINERGFIREGYFADLVLINPDAAETVDKSNILFQKLGTTSKG